MTGCEHNWINRPGQPLACGWCGLVWPGEELPEPAHKREGYGELRDQPSWRSRLDSMIAGLDELEPAA